jgi:hypothetical protein
MTKNIEIVNFVRGFEAGTACAQFDISVDGVLFNTLEWLDEDGDIVRDDLNNDVNPEVMRAARDAYDEDMEIWNFKKLVFGLVEEKLEISRVRETYDWYWLGEGGGSEMGGGENEEKAPTEADIRGFVAEMLSGCSDEEETSGIMAGQIVVVRREYDKDDCNVSSSDERTPVSDFA